jgi:CDP-diacylglycerol--glycerol-3-phosphate 3-phosphatidyltransferase
MNLPCWREEEALLNRLQSMWPQPTINLISGSRFGLAVAFTVFFHIGNVAAVWIMVIITVLSESSDLIDGGLARSTRSTSSEGGLLDSMSDSFCRLTQFLCFTSIGLVPLWLMLILFWRDSILAFIRLLAFSKGEFYGGTRWSGKLKGIGQGVGLLILTTIYAQTGGTLDVNRTHLQSIAIGLIAVTTFTSAVDYLVANRRILISLFER